MLSGPFHPCLSIALSFPSCAEILGFLLEIFARIPNSLYLGVFFLRLLPVSSGAAGVSLGASGIDLAASVLVHSDYLCKFFSGDLSVPLAPALSPGLDLLLPSVMSQLLPLIANFLFNCPNSSYFHSAGAGFLPSLAAAFPWRRSPCSFRCLICEVIIPFFLFRPPFTFWFHSTPLFDFCFSAIVPLVTSRRADLFSHFCLFSLFLLFPAIED